MNNAGKPDPVETEQPAPAKRPWAKWLAIGGFWFFLLKGLAWLAVAGAAWMFATN